MLLVIITSGYRYNARLSAENGLLPMNFRGAGNSKAPFSKMETGLCC